MAHPASAQADFRAHINELHSIGIDGQGVDQPFTTQRSLEDYWTTGQIQDALGYHVYSNFQDLDTIRESYLRVFSILVLIDRVHWIDHFIRYTNLNDDHLPFPSVKHPPHHWPLDKDFELFYKAQWQFCPQKLDRKLLMSARNFEEDQILPFTIEKFMEEGDSAKTYKVKLHPEYNNLVGNEYPAPIASTFVLKTYHTDDARKYYDNEVSAYKHLHRGNHKKDHSNLITFYGSWRHGRKYSILLEYANKGTLLDYFNTVAPPTRTADINMFWGRLLKITDAVRQIHHVLHGQDETKSYQGIHQDIKPSNILVLSGSNSSVYDVEFKLADLGLSHFKSRGAQKVSVKSKDGYGTMMYSAPECCRINDTLQHSDLAVTPKIDVFSLGCTFSEAAVWVVLGNPGLKEYEQARRLETNDIPELTGAGYDGCFHNGFHILTAVTAMLDRLTQERRLSDLILDHVVMLIRGMLDEEPKRFESLHAYTNAERIMGAVEDKNFPKSLRTIEGPIVQRRTPPQIPPSLPLGTATASAIDAFSPPLTPPGNHYRYSDQTLSGLGLIDTQISENGTARNGTRVPDSSSTSPSPNRPESGSDWRSSSRKSYRQSQFGSLRLNDRFQPLREEGHDASHSSDPVRLSRTSTEQTHQRLGSGIFRASQEEPVRNRDSRANSTASTDNKVTVQDVLNCINCRPRRSLPPSVQSILGRLDGRDHVFLIDDSASMKPNWPKVSRVFQALAYIVKRGDRDGIDLYFTSSPTYTNHKHTNNLVTAIEQHKISQGRSDMKFALGNIVERFGPQLSSPEKTRKSFLSKLSPTASSQSKEKRGLSIYVLTDGVWQDGPAPVCGVEQPIALLVKKVINNGQLDRKVGIQFIRFGNDPTGIRRLDILDSELTKMFEDIPMDIVDATRHDEGVDKMLLGAIDRWVDRDKPSPTPSQRRDSKAAYNNLSTSTQNG